MIHPHRQSPDLRQEAQELARLAQSIPGEREQVNHGVLPKDFNDKLKRIEKLSKRARNDLTLLDTCSHLPHERKGHLPEGGWPTAWCVGQTRR